MSASGGAKTAELNGSEFDKSSVPLHPRVFFRLRALPLSRSIYRQQLLVVYRHLPKALHLLTTPMSVFTRLKSFVSTPLSSPKAASPSSKDNDKQLAPQDLSPDGLPLPRTAALEGLKGVVPLSDCDDCSVWLEKGEDGAYEGPSFPKKFEVDLESEMLGTSSTSERLHSFLPDRC
jgi:hypothetical protein